MKLYLIEQDVNNDYDTYSDAVVCAESPQEAKKIHPGGELDGTYRADDKKAWYEQYNDYDTIRYSSWCQTLDQVSVTYLGEAKKSLKKGVVCASFHAG